MAHMNTLMQPSSLPYGVPDWQAYSPDDFLPAMEAAMATERQQWEAIAANPAPATVANTLEAIEDAGRETDRISSIIFTYFSSIGGETYAPIEAELGPKLTEHEAAFYFNKALYQRLASLDVSDESEEVQTWFADTLKAFRMHGVELEGEEANRLREIDQELSLATIEFGHCVVQAMSDNALIIDDVAELEGASTSELEQWRQDNGTYRIPLANFTSQPPLATLARHETRQKLHEASLSRGLGAHPSSDSRALVKKIVSLRAERAALLGFPHHAEVVAQREMAGSSEKIMELLDSVMEKAMAAVETEGQKLRAMAHADGLEEFTAADWPYYAEKLRARFGLDDDAMRPYFLLENVVEKGVFFAAQQLYGITFTPRPDIAGYVPTMLTWEVKDENGRGIGLFQADYYHRPGKKGGAWMHSVMLNSAHDGTQPVILNNTNFPEPKDGEPLLLTWDNVITLFHEFGHALHGLLSNVTYRGRSGTHVPRDFVEMPSQLNEMWAWDPQVLANYARHYKTGEPLPQELIDTLVSMRTFGEDYATSELTAAMIVDQEWHRLTPNAVPEDIDAFEQSALASHGITFVPPRYRSAYFAHTFSGGYDAGYYSYLWADVLVAEVQKWWGEQGEDRGFNRTVGRRYVEELLSRGSSRPVMDSFLALVGHEPDSAALLERRGLA